MRFVQASRFRFGARQAARASLATAGFLLLSGLFSGAQVGCLLADQYQCGGKNSSGDCSYFTQLADCQTHPACEWRVGCASGCNRARTDAECSQHLSCGIIGENRTCFGYGCRLPPYNSAVMTAEECATTTDCNWEPSCWDAPNTECDYKLDEAECARRNCRWEKVDRSL